MTAHCQLTAGHRALADQDENLQPGSSGVFDRRETCHGKGLRLSRDLKLKMRAPLDLEH